jgi:hypothetical protein
MYEIGQKWESVPLHVVVGSFGLSVFTQPRSISPFRAPMSNVTSAAVRSLSELASNLL